MNNKRKLLILPILIICSIVSCKQKEESQVETENATILESSVQLTDAQYKNANLQVSVPEKMNIGHVIHLNGKMEVMPENTITVNSPMAGFVRQIRWMPGMNVSKGQALVRIEEKEFIQLQQDYLSVKNTLAFAKMDYERQSELSKNQAASEKVLQMAEEKLKQNQIMLKSLGEKLKLIHIKPTTLTAENMTSQIVISAPVSGMITEVFINSGKYVHAGDDMIKMIDKNGSRLVLKAFEKDLSYLKTGQKIVAFSNTQSDKKLSGRIEYIINHIGEQGFANIICSLDGQPSELLQGMYMNAQVEVQSMDSWTVPDEALVNFEGKEYVFVEKGKQTYEMQELIVGQKEKGKVRYLLISTGVTQLM